MPVPARPSADLAAPLGPAAPGVPQPDGGSAAPGTSGIAGPGRRNTRKWVARPKPPAANSSRPTNASRASARDSVNRSPSPGVNLTLRGPAESAVLRVPRCGPTAEPLVPSAFSSRCAGVQSQVSLPDAAGQRRIEHRGRSHCGDQECVAAVAVHRQGRTRRPPEPPTTSWAGCMQRNWATRTGFTLPDDAVERRGGKRRPAVRRRSARPRRGLQMPSRAQSATSARTDACCPGPPKGAGIPRPTGTDVTPGPVSLRTIDVALRRTRVGAAHDVQRLHRITDVLVAGPLPESDHGMPDTFVHIGQVHRVDSVLRPARAAGVSELVLRQRPPGAGAWPGQTWLSSAGFRGREPSWSFKCGTTASE